MPSSECKQSHWESLKALLSGLCFEVTSPWWPVSKCYSWILVVGLRRSMENVRRGRLYSCWESNQISRKRMSDSFQLVTISSVLVIRAGKKLESRVSTPATPNADVGSHAQSRFHDDVTRGLGCTVCACAEAAIERSFKGGLHAIATGSDTKSLQLTVVSLLFKETSALTTIIRRLWSIEHRSDDSFLSNYSAGPLIRKAWEIRLFGFQDFGSLCSGILIQIK
jgi:hypothetical protein